MKITIVNKTRATFDIRAIRSFEVTSPAGALGGPSVLFPGETLKIETGRDAEFTLLDDAISVELA